MSISTTKELGAVPVVALKSSRTAASSSGSVNIIRRLVDGICFSNRFGVSKSIKRGGGVVKLVVITLRQMSGITVPTFWRASLARRVWLAGRCTRRSARLCNRPVIQPRPDLTSVGGVGGAGILRLMYRYAGTQQAQKSRPVAARLQVTCTQVTRTCEARNRARCLLPSRAHLRGRLPGCAPGGQRYRAFPAA